MAQEKYGSPICQAIWTNAVPTFLSVVNNPICCCGDSSRRHIWIGTCFLPHTLLSALELDLSSLQQPLWEVALRFFLEAGCFLLAALPCPFPGSSSWVTVVTRSLIPRVKWPVQLGFTIWQGESLLLGLGSAAILKSICSGIGVPLWRTNCTVPGSLRMSLVLSCSRWQADSSERSGSSPG